MYVSSFIQTISQPTSTSFVKLPFSCLLLCSCAKASTVPDVSNCLAQWFLGAMQTCIARTSYGNVAGWLGVCHSRYCIKTTKPILTLFRPSGSPIIEASGTPSADTKFQGEPLHRGRLIHGGGKIGDFRPILPFISEMVRDRPMVTMER